MVWSYPHTPGTLNKNMVRLKKDPWKATPCSYSIALLGNKGAVFLRPCSYFYGHFANKGSRHCHVLKFMDRNWGQITRKNYGDHFGIALSRKKGLCS